MNLDDAYANAPYIPDGAGFPDRWRAQADTFRRQMSVLNRARLGVMYGHGSRETLDLFIPHGEPAGLFVFVHGGYWRQFDGTLWSHLARGFVERGWAVAIPTYDLCPRVRIADITRQVAQAISASAHEFGGPICLSGHSAGGHLVARMLAPDMLPDDVFTRIAHVVPISPLADLRPLMNTAMNADFKLDKHSAAAESPALMAPPSKPVTVWVGAEERPVFRDQARLLADAWNCGLTIAPGKHHFDVIDPLTDPDSDLVSTILGRTLRQN
ncbi:alpha/beta hydrolase [Marivita sp. GX14005]|uniref:alpha/beta hydrolase n=1 Tax=Marivita sp. GX14005 TaxID=2942276 RepID=UPI0020184BBF|nr:alpha/beta hydrolase [Marivita sp. GX14005]